MSTDPAQIMQQPIAPVPSLDLNGAVTTAATQVASQVATQLVSSAKSDLEAVQRNLADRLTLLEQAATPAVNATVTDFVQGVGKADSAVLGAVVHDTWLQRALALTVVGLAGVIILVILVAALLGDGTAQKYVNDALAGAGVLLALIARVEGITLPGKATS